MKVTVEPKTVCGTDRGGEDLFLVFTASGEPSDHFTVEPVDGDPSWHCEGDDDDPGVLWCRTGHYEFKWEGTLEDLHQLAEDAGVTCPDEWEWCGPVTSPPQRRWCYEHFVGGNAE